MIWRFEGFAFTDHEEYEKAVRTAIDRDLQHLGPECQSVRRLKFVRRSKDSAATIPLPTPSLVRIAMATTQQECVVKIISKKESIFHANNQRHKSRAWKAGRATQKLPLAKRSF